MKIFDSFISILSNSYGLAISQFAAVFHYFCLFFGWPTCCNGGRIAKKFPQQVCFRRTGY